MKDFRFLVKVNPEDPEAALKRLGKLVEDNEAAFDLDLDFVVKQDFITAVPIEIALTGPMRSTIIYNNPSCHFVIVGVPSNRVSNLTEMGYKVYVTTVKVEDIPEDQPRPMDRTIGKKDSLPAEDELLELADEPAAKVTYWYNGERIGKEEFREKTAEIEKALEKFKEQWPFFGKLLD